MQPAPLRTPPPRWCCFNPHPPVGAGATTPAHHDGASPACVSILTRPWGRVQHRPVPLAPHLSRSFNPHPPVGAGATLRPARWITDGASFNPHPPVGAGAARDARAAGCVGQHVSILTRPWGRVQRERVGRVFGVVAVSILTRPWGRVQHQIARNENIPFSVSILTRPWGRVQRPPTRACAADTTGFNPHPPVGAGATLQASAGADGQLLVSILARPWGRVQRFSNESWSCRR